MWSLRTEQRLTVLELDPPGQSTEGAFSSSGAHIAVGYDDGRVGVWRFPDGALVRSLSPHEGRVACLAYATNETLATGGLDRSIAVIAKDGTLLGRLLGHEQPVRAIAWADDGHTLVSAGNDATVKFWGRRSRQYRHPSCESGGAPRAWRRDQFDFHLARRGSYPDR